MNESEIYENIELSTRKHLWLCYHHRVATIFVAIASFLTFGAENAADPLSIYLMMWKVRQ
jgi:hypothetical protein